jgi:hypothetical protein
MTTETMTTTTDAAAPANLDPLAFERARQADTPPSDHPLHRAHAKRTEAAREADARIRQAALREAIVGVAPDGDQLAADLDAAGKTPDDYFAAVGELLDLATVTTAAGDGARLIAEALEAGTHYQVVSATHGEQMQALKRSKVEARAAQRNALEREHAHRARLARFFDETGATEDAAPLWRRLDEARREVAEARSAVRDGRTELDRWRRREVTGWSASQRSAAARAQRDLEHAERKVEHLRDRLSRPDLGEPETAAHRVAEIDTTRQRGLRFQLSKMLATAEDDAASCAQALERLRAQGDPDEAVQAGVAKATKAVAAAERKADAKCAEVAKAMDALDALAASVVDRLCGGAADSSPKPRSRKASKR